MLSNDGEQLVLAVANALVATLMTIGLALLLMPLVGSAWRRLRRQATARAA